MIVTYKPDVIGEWLDTVNNHVDFTDWQAIRAKAKRERKHDPCLTDSGDFPEAKEQHTVVCVSLQDLSIDADELEKLKRDPNTTDEEKEQAISDSIEKDKNKERQTLKKWYATQIKRLAICMADFIYMTYEREYNIDHVIQTKSPHFFAVMTGITKDDFTVLCDRGFMNRSALNRIVREFRDQEESSLKPEEFIRASVLICQGVTTTVKVALQQRWQTLDTDQQVKLRIICNYQQVHQATSKPDSDGLAEFPAFTVTDSFRGRCVAHAHYRQGPDNLRHSKEFNVGDFSELCTSLSELKVVAGKQFQLCEDERYAYDEIKLSSACGSGVKFFALHQYTSFPKDHYLSLRLVVVGKEIPSNCQLQIKKQSFLVGKEKGIAGFIKEVTRNEDDRLEVTLQEKLADNNGLFISFLSKPANSDWSNGDWHKLSGGGLTRFIVPANRRVDVLVFKRDKGEVWWDYFHSELE